MCKGKNVTALTLHTEEEHPGRSVMPILRGVLLSYD